VTDPEALLSIWTRISKGREIDYRMITGLSVPYRYWDKKKERPKNYTGDNKDIAEYLAKLDKRLTSLRIRLYESAIMHEAFTKDMAKAIIDDVVSIVKDNGIPRDVDKYCHMVIDQMETGVRTISTDGRSTTTAKGKPYTKGTIKSWKVFLHVLEAYTSEHPLSWENISETRLAEFKSYMSDHGYMNASQNRFIGTFKALAWMAQDDGIHKMDEKVYRSMSREDEKSFDAKTTKVYLTDAEIEALYNMPLDPGSLKDKIRDVFLMGCYTGQRISDYNHLDPSMFTKTNNGYDVIKLRQQKTKHELSIPVIFGHVHDIAKKYDYNMPTINDVVLNRYIKDLCQELAQSVPSLNDKIVTALTLRDEAMDKKSIAKGKGPIYTRDSYGHAIRSKWELVCSHTARRSCITNLYLSEILSDQEIMAISGHADYKSYKTYLRMSGDTIAEKIIDKMNKAKGSEDE